MTDTNFFCSVCVVLLSALLMDPLLIRCMLGFDEGCCYLQPELFDGAKRSSGFSLIFAVTRRDVKEHLKLVVG